MGLDVYFHKVKKVRSSKSEPLKSISKYWDLVDERATKRFSDFAAESLEKLEKSKDDVGEYERIYNEIFPGKMKEFTEYVFKYIKMCDGVHSIDEVREFFDHFAKAYYAESDAYFRKVNFLYRFFEDKLEDERCFVTKSDIEELISRCDKVMADNSLAVELLPTRSGLFFGSTDYDEWYFKDVKDVKYQMSKLLEDFDEDTDIIFVVMSW